MVPHRTALYPPPGYRAPRTVPGVLIRRTLLIAGLILVALWLFVTIAHTLHNADQAARARCGQLGGVVIEVGDGWYCR